MTTEPSTVLLLVPICLWMIDVSQQCKLNGHWAYCSSQSLQQVPPLPPEITHLDLSLNRIQQLSEDSFRGLENLVHLDLGWQRLSGLRIRNNTFRGLVNLTFLHLGRNYNLRLDTGAFLGLSNLQSLTLLGCQLGQDIFSGRYLEPLRSLHTLDLYGNQIRQLTPAVFFKNLTALTDVNLKQNRMKSICEADLVAFQGKHFDYLNLDSVSLSDMNQWGFNWEKCGNPFRNISFGTLDLANNGLTAVKAELLFTSMQGTKIHRLILNFNNMGSGYWFGNLKDPDSSTFDSLKSSGIKDLYISMNSIHLLKKDVFRSLVDLENLSLENNEISKFQENAFVGLSNVQSLNLSNNLIGVIYSDTFMNLQNLLLLDLSNNYIALVETDSFKGLLNLISLNLTGNSLSRVDKFASLPRLREVHLDGNKIQSIYRLDKFARNVELIKLENNRLRNLEDLYIIMTSLPHVKSLTLGDNFFSYCYLNSNYSIPANNTLLWLDLHSSALQLIWDRGLCLHLFHRLANLLYLFLQSNQLQDLPNGIFTGLSSLLYLDLSYNSLTHLRKGVFPESLQQLDLSDNFLSCPDPDVLRSLRVVYLHNNRFYCDCRLKEFTAWANESRVVSPGLSALLCAFPVEERGVALSNFTTGDCEEDDERQVQVLRLVLFVSSTSVLGALIVIAITYARFRGFAFGVYQRLKTRVLDGNTKEVTPEGLPTDNFQYDVYVCFPESEFIWVEAALLKRLDAQLAEGNRLHCCFEARDFLPGEDHLTNIRSAIWGSRKTLCVVSKAFLRDGWCLEAFLLAQGRVLEELKDVLVVVVVGSIPHFRLMKYEPIRNFLKNRDYLKWPEDVQDVEWFFDRLLREIFRNANLKQPNGPEEAPDGIQLQAVRQVNT